MEKDGKYLGNKITDEILENIRSGKFDMFHKGDYFIINDHKYVIEGGYTERIYDDKESAGGSVKHHLVVSAPPVMPVNVMNDGGGYKNSIAYKSFCDYKHTIPSSLLQAAIDNGLVINNEQKKV